jgi:hypothetical protein
VLFENRPALAGGAADGADGRVPRLTSHVLSRAAGVCGTLSIRKTIPLNQNQMLHCESHHYHITEAKTSEGYNHRP